MRISWMSTVTINQIGFSREKPIWFIVTVLIHDIRIQLTQFWPKEVEPVISRGWPCAGDELNLGVAPFDGLREAGVALYVLRPPLFVTNAEQLEVKRLRVTHRGAFGPPLATRRPVSKFHQVKHVLDVRLELVHRNELGCVELAGHAAIED